MSYIVKVHVHMLLSMVQTLFYCIVLFLYLSHNICVMLLLKISCCLCQEAIFIWWCFNLPVGHLLQFSIIQNGSCFQVTCLEMSLLNFLNLFSTPYFPFLSQDEELLQYLGNIFFVIFRRAFVEYFCHTL